MVNADTSRSQSPAIKRFSPQVRVVATIANEILRWRRTIIPFPFYGYPIPIIYHGIAAMFSPCTRTKHLSISRFVHRFNSTIIRITYQTAVVAIIAVNRNIQIGWYFAPTETQSKRWQLLLSESQLLDYCSDTVDESGLHQ